MLRGDRQSSCRVTSGARHLGAFALVATVGAAILPSALGESWDTSSYGYGGYGSYGSCGYGYGYSFESSWGDFGGACSTPPGEEVSCEEYTMPKSCRSDITCKWDSDVKECSDACSAFNGKPVKCVKLDECSYDEGEDMCLESITCDEYHGKPVKCDDRPDCSFSRVDDTCRTACSVFDGKPVKCEQLEHCEYDRGDETCSEPVEEEGEEGEGPAPVDDDNEVVEDDGESPKPSPPTTTPSSPTTPTGSYGSPDGAYGGGNYGTDTERPDQCVCSVAEFTAFMGMSMGERRATIEIDNEANRAAGYGDAQTVARALQQLSDPSEMDASMFTDGFGIYALSGQVCECNPSPSPSPLPSPSPSPSPSPDGESPQPVPSPEPTPSPDDEPVQAAKVVEILVAFTMNPEDIEDFDFDAYAAKLAADMSAELGGADVEVVITLKVKSAYDFGGAAGYDCDQVRATLAASYAKPVEDVTIAECADATRRRGRDLRGRRLLAEASVAVEFSLEEKAAAAAAVAVDPTADIAALGIEARRTQAPELSVESKVVAEVTDPAAQAIDLTTLASTAAESAEEGAAAQGITVEATAEATDVTPDPPAADDDDPVPEEDDDVPDPVPEDDEPEPTPEDKGGSSSSIGPIIGGVAGGVVVLGGAGAFMYMRSKKSQSKMMPADEGI